MLFTLNNKNFNLPLFPWWFFIYVYTIILPLSLKNKPFISFSKRTTAPLPWDFGLIPGHPILCIAVLSCPISSHVTCYSLHLEYPPRNHVLKARLPGPDTTVECETIGGDRILGRKSGKLTIDVPLKGHMGLPSLLPVQLRGHEGRSLPDMLPQHRWKAIRPSHQDRNTWNCEQ